MKITKLTLENFRLFEKLELPFPNSNFIVFIGENGSGKSAILDAIAIGLSNIIVNDEIMLEALSPILLSTDDIKNGATNSSIELLFFDSFGKSLNVNIYTNRPILVEGGYLEFSNEKNFPFPILTYYRVNRTHNNNKDQNDSQKSEKSTKKNSKN